MILHSLVTRGSLVIAEYSESSEDYQQIAKKAIFEIKKTDGEHKIQKDNYVIYAICTNELKFISLLESEDDKVFEILKQLQLEYTTSVQNDGNLTQQLTQKMAQLLSRRPKQPQQDINDVSSDSHIQMPPPLETKRQVPTITMYGCHIDDWCSLCRIELYNPMNEILRITQLEEQNIHILKLLDPIKCALQNLNAKVGLLDTFITDNPRLDLITETIRMLNKELKLSERIDELEGKQLEQTTQFHSKLTMHAIQIQEQYPWISEMRSMIEEARANKDINTQLKLNFKELQQRQQQVLERIIEIDQHLQFAKLRTSSLENVVATKIDHKEVTQLQCMLRSEFVTCIQLDDYKNQLHQRFDMVALNFGKREDINRLQEQLEALHNRCENTLKKLVDEQLEGLAMSKLKHYSTKYDLRQLNDSMNYLYSQNYDKQQKHQQSIDVSIKNLQDIIKDCTSKNVDFKQQIGLINQSLQKMVMKDDLQQNIEKTLRLQRESEFLNDKLEQLSNQVFEHKLNITALHKQRTLDMQQMQQQQQPSQSSQPSQQLIEVNPSPVPLQVKTNRKSVDEEERDKYDSNSLSSSHSPTRVRRRLSLLKSRSIQQPNPDKINYQEQIQKLLQKQDDKYTLLLNEVQGIKLINSSNRQHLEIGSMQDIDKPNINTQIYELKRRLTELEIQQQVECDTTSNKALLIIDELKRQVQQKLTNFQWIETQVQQKCDSSLIIPILDQKGNQQDIIILQNGIKLIKSTLLDLLQNLRTYFVSDQSNQIIELLNHQLNKQIGILSQQQLVCDEYNEEWTCRTDQLRPKSQAITSRRKYSEQQPYTYVMKGNKIKDQVKVKTENVIVDSQKSSPLVSKLFKISNSNRNRSVKL